MARFFTVNSLNGPLSVPPSSPPLHPPNQNEKKEDRAPGRQLGAAQVHGQREPSARDRLAEGRQAPDRAGGW